MINIIENRFMQYFRDLVNDGDISLTDAYGSYMIFDRTMTLEMFTNYVRNENDRDQQY